MLQVVVFHLLALVVFHLLAWVLLVNLNLDSSSRVGQSHMDILYHLQTYFLPSCIVLMYLFMLLPLLLFFTNRADPFVS